MQGSRPQRFKIVRDFFALSGGQLLSKVIGFVAFAYLARVLDPASYGTVEWAIGLAFFFAVVIEGGLGPIGVREISLAPQRAVELSALIPTVRLCIACVAIPVMGIGVYAAGQSAGTVHLVWLFALSLLAVPWNQEWLFQGLEMMNSQALAQVVRMTVFTLGVVAFVHGSDDLLHVGVVEIAAVSTMAAYYLVIQHYRIGSVRLRFSYAKVQQLVSQSFSVGASNILGSVVQFYPLFLMVSLVGGAETGWFAASHRLVVSLLTFSSVYHFNLFPLIARRTVDSSTDMDALLRSSFRVTSWVGILVGLVLTVLAEPLLTLAFGERFAAAAAAFAILIWVLPVTLLSGHARWLLIASGHQQYVLFAQIAGAATGLVAGLALIPALQAVGAAIAMLAASVAVWAVAHIMSTTHVERLPSLSIIWRPALLAIAGGLLASSLDLNAWLVAAVAGAGYVVAAPLLDSRLFGDFHRLAHAKADLNAQS